MDAVLKKRILLVFTVLLVGFTLTFSAVLVDVYHISAGNQNLSNEEVAYFFINNDKNIDISKIDFTNLQYVGEGSVVNYSYITNDTQKMLEIISTEPETKILSEAETIQWNSCLKLFNRVCVFGRIEDKNFSESENYSAQSLHVEGNRIVNALGDEVILKGFSCCSSTRLHSKSLTNWSTWYNDTSINEVKSWGTNIFRITLKPEQYMENPDIVELLFPYIDLCINNGLYVLVTWMGNQDYLNYIDEAKEFFSKVTLKYAESPYLIYEVANEPFHAKWMQLKTYAEEVIPYIRRNSPNAVVMVPMPFATSSEDDNQLAIIGNAVEYENIVYTYHMYAASSLQSKTLFNLLSVQESGVPVFISEWATTDSSGQRGFDENASNVFLSYLEDNEIGWIYFQLSDCYWNNIPYECSVVKMGEWSDSLQDDILSSSGYYIKHYLLGNNDSYNTYAYLKTLNNYDHIQIECQMMSYYPEYAFWNSEVKNKITSVKFKSNGFCPDEYVDTWDVSMDIGSRNVIAYLCEDGILYISAKSGNVVAPVSMQDFFSEFLALRDVEMRELDTSKVTRMDNLFRACGELTNIDMNGCRTEMVSNLSMAFSGTNIDVIDLSSCELSSVTNWNLTFRACGHLNRIVMPDINSSNVVTAKAMFEKVGNGTGKLEVVVQNEIDAKFIDEKLSEAGLLNTFKLED